MWDKVLGHEQNKEFLKSLLVGERFTPSLLFYGPEGVGKRLLAKEFAKSFLCLNDPLATLEETQGAALFGGAPAEDTASAGALCTCRSCKAMEAGTHPDFIQVSQLAPGKELLIDQIKEMSKQASYAPTLSTHKVCIIDGADFMKAPAANSLLKLLEEPPAYWLFILIATDINRLLPTILSRVIQRQFKGLEVDQISQILATKAQEAATGATNAGGASLGATKAKAVAGEATGNGGVNATQATELLAHAPLLASLADGSPGKALAYGAADAPMWRERALFLMEHAGTESIMEFLGGLDWLDKINTQDGALLLEMLTLLLRDALMEKAQVKCAYYNEDSLMKIRACFSRWTSQDLEKALVWTGESARGVAAYSGAKGVIESLLLKINGMRSVK